MSKKAAQSLAKELLEGEPGGLEELRIHEFSDDESAHDDEKIEKLCGEFSSELERAEGVDKSVWSAVARWRV